MSSEHTDAAGDGDDGSEPSSASEPDVSAVWREHADAITNAEMPMERLTAAEPVFREMAKADAVGESVAMWIDQLRAIDDTMPKPTLREQYERVRDDVLATLPEDAIEGATPLDAWLTTHTERVVVYSSPDAHADAEYRWHLTDGRTFATDGNTHFRWQALRKAIFNALGERPGQPEPADNADWPAWVMGFINEHREERETLGPRSEAIADLADKLRDATATPDAEDAVRGGVFGRVWMASADADTVRVPAETIRRITDEHGITPRAFQVELDARGLLDGHSRPETLDSGRTVRFWSISTDLATPGAFEPEPPSARS
jgi:hypothetical protein